MVSILIRNDTDHVLKDMTVFRQIPFSRFAYAYAAFLVLVRSPNDESGRRT